MTTLMYAVADIHSRDPFGSKDTFDAHQTSLHSFPSYLDFNRALTPPPEMSGVTQASRPSYYQQEHAHHYGDYLPSHYAAKAPVGPYLPQEVSNAQFGRNGVTTQPNSRPLSPALPSRQPAADDVQAYSQQRRGSQPSAIAPSFQIPKSVNDSGGSLSELAAQVSSCVNSMTLLAC
jgi:hypothetical protein